MVTQVCGCQNSAIFFCKSIVLCHIFFLWQLSCNPVSLAVLPDKPVLDNSFRHSTTHFFKCNFLAEYQIVWQPPACYHFCHLIFCPKQTLRCRDSGLSSDSKLFYCKQTDKLTVYNYRNYNNIRSHFRTWRELRRTSQNLRPLMQIK